MTYCFLSESFLIFVSSLSCFPSNKVRDVVIEALMSVFERWWQNSGSLEPWVYSLGYLYSCGPFRNWLLCQEVCLLLHKMRSAAQINVSSPCPHHPQSTCTLFLMLSPNVIVILVFQNPVLSSLPSFSWSYIMAWFLATVFPGIYETLDPQQNHKVEIQHYIYGRGAGIRLALHLLIFSTTISGSWVYCITIPVFLSVG